MVATPKNINCYILNAYNLGNPAGLLSTPPFNAERQAGKMITNFEVIVITRFGIKHESTALEVRALFIQPRE